VCVLVWEGLSIYAYMVNVEFAFQKYNHDLGLKCGWKNWKVDDY
jgi:hypothetical protein